jgi:hypothetical protein
MKILFTPNTSDIINDFYQHILAMGHDIIWWNHDISSIYSILDNIIPDIMFITNTCLTPTTLQAINHYNVPTVSMGITNKFPQCKLICLTTNIPTQIQQHIELPIYILSPAANICSTYNIEKYNILYHYTNNESAKYIEYLHGKNISFKVIGDIQIPYPEYIGKVNLVDKLSLYKAATINIVDNLENIYNIAINNSFALVNQSNEIYPSFSTLEELIQQIQEYTINDKKRTSIIKKADALSKKHTYYHHWYNILNRLNFTEEAEKCLLKTSAL